MIVFTFVSEKSEKKNTKRKFEQELDRLKINQDKQKNLKDNTVYLDLFESSKEDFQGFLEKILDILQPEIDKLKTDKNNIKNTIFWGNSEKTENIKNRVFNSLTKYKALSYLSAYIPIPILDIYSEYKVREFMFDRIAKEYKELLEDKIPDNYEDPDVRKIVAKASKYTFLRKDGTFYPKKKYKDIYEKLKKNKNSNSHIKNIQNEENKNNDEPISSNIIEEERLDENNKNEEKSSNLIESINEVEEAEEEIEDKDKNEAKIENEDEKTIESKKQFENIFFEKEEGLNDIQQTNCSKLKGAGNIANSTLKSSSTIGGIGIHVGVRGIGKFITKDGGKEVIKNAIKIGGKQLSKNFISLGIPIIGEILCGSIFGAINLKSLKNKINKIVKEIDESLTGNENIQKSISEKYINYFNELKNKYYNEFSKEGNYDVDFDGLEENINK